MAGDGTAWLETAGRAVLDRLAGSQPLSARQLREELPELTGAVTVDLHKKYGGTFQLAPRVLTLLGAEGRITRGPNAGHWRLSRPTWTVLRRSAPASLQRHRSSIGRSSARPRWTR